MDDIRKYACELSQRSTVHLSVDEEITAAKKWEAYLREPVPEETKVLTPEAIDPDAELFPDLTDDQLHRLSLGLDEQNKRLGDLLEDLAKGEREYVYGSQKPV